MNRVLLSSVNRWYTPLRRMGGLELLIDAAESAGASNLPALPTFGSVHRNPSATTLLSVEDLSGRGRALAWAAAHDPAWTLAGWTGGQASLRMAKGSVQYLVAAMGAIPQPYTLVVVNDGYKADGISGNHNMLNGGGGILYSVSNQGNYTMYAGTPTDTGVGVNTIRRILFAIFDGANSIFYRGTTASAALNPGTGVFGGQVIGIGARNDGVDPCTMDLVQAAVYSKRLSTEEMATWMTIAASRYSSLNLT